MKTLFVILMLVVSVGTATAGGPGLYANADTEIVGYSVDVPDGVKKGYSYTVLSSMTVRYNAAAKIDTTDGFARAESGFDARLGVADFVSVDSSDYAYSMEFGSNAHAVVNIDGTVTLNLSATYITGSGDAGRRYGAVYGFGNVYAGAWADYSGQRFAAWDYDEDVFRHLWAIDIEKRYTSLPVAEHVVWHELPSDTWWCELSRLELDGVWTPVPSLFPANQLPSPVHGDLMVHGGSPCEYMMTVFRVDGSSYEPRIFTVSPGGGEFWYSTMRRERS